MCDGNVETTALQVLVDRRDVEPQAVMEGCGLGRHSVILAGNLIDEVEEARGEKDGVLGALAVQLEQTDAALPAVAYVKEHIVEGERRDAVALGMQDVAATAVAGIGFARPKRQPSGPEVGAPDRSFCHARPIAVLLQEVARTAGVSGLRLVAVDLTAAAIKDGEREDADVSADIHDDVIGVEGGRQAIAVAGDDLVHDLKIVGAAPESKGWVSNGKSLERRLAERMGRTLEVALRLLQGFHPQQQATVLPDEGQQQHVEPAGES